MTKQASWTANSWNQAKADDERRRGVIVNGEKNTELHAWRG